MNKVGDTIFYHWPVLRSDGARRGVIMDTNESLCHRVSIPGQTIVTYVNDVDIIYNVTTLDALMTAMVEL